MVKRIDAIGICFEIGAWRNTKVTGLWIDCVKTRFAGRSIFARLNPGDVITDGSHFPAFKSFGRNHHGEISFATCRGECCRNVVFLSLWRCNAENEHVLCKPALVSSHSGRNAQGKTLLAQQGIAAITRTKRPDLTGLGIMNNVFGWIVGPDNVLLAGP